MTKGTRCANAEKHTWAWHANVTRGVYRPNSATLTLRGLYKCTSCGAQKYGKPNHAGPDLRGLVGADTFVASATKRKAA